MPLGCFVLDEETNLSAIGGEKNAGNGSGAEKDACNGGATENRADSESNPYKKKGFWYGFYLCFKRFSDILFSLLFLVLFSWLILLCLLIKFLEDFHNPIYVSVRIGKDGKPFKFFKIRSMRPDAEELKAKLIEQGLNEADPPAFKMKNDPRITGFGKFLRKTSLDEILQFINVLNGTMSIVGPRPPLPEEVEKYNDYQKQRLSVKGGLLCLWQIRKNRHSISFDEWVESDLKYIKNQSAWLDFKIVVKGFFAVLFDHSGE